MLLQLSIVGPPGDNRSEVVCIKPTVFVGWVTNWCCRDDIQSSSLTWGVGRAALLVYYCLGASSQSTRELMMSLCYAESFRWISRTHALLPETFALLPGSIGSEEIVAGSPRQFNLWSTYTRPSGILGMSVGFKGQGLGLTGELARWGNHTACLSTDS